MKNRVSKATTLNAAAKIRLAAVEEYKAGGVTLQDLAQEYKVHKTTIRAWVLMYEQGGVEALKTYMKPRPHHTLPLDELEALHTANPADEITASLLDLARGAGLNETAAKWGITPQGLAKRRRVWLAEKAAK